MQAHGWPWAVTGSPLGHHGHSIGGPQGTMGSHWVPLEAHGEAICRPMERQWGAMWAEGGHYMNTLPINRPSGRYVIINITSLFLHLLTP